jgi:hypothetical protein
MTTRKRTVGRHLAALTFLIAGFGATAAQATEYVVIDRGPGHYRLTSVPTEESTCEQNNLIVAATPGAAKAMKKFVDPAGGSSARFVCTAELYGNVQYLAVCDAFKLSGCHCIENCL